MNNIHIPFMKCHPPIIPQMTENTPGTIGAVVGKVSFENTPGTIGGSGGEG